MTKRNNYKSRILKHLNLPIREMIIRVASFVTRVVTFVRCIKCKQAKVLKSALE